MRYRLLGQTGLRISELCLGAMTFGNARSWGADEALSQALFNRFAKGGHLYRHRSRLSGRLLYGDFHDRIDAPSYLKL